MRRASSLLVAVAMVAWPMTAAHAGAKPAATNAPVYVPAAPHFALASPRSQRVGDPPRIATPPSEETFFLTDPLEGLPIAFDCFIHTIDARIAAAEDRADRLEARNKDLFEKALHVNPSSKNPADQAVRTTAGEVSGAISRLNGEVESLRTRKRACLSNGSTFLVPVGGVAPFGEPVTGSPPVDMILHGIIGGEGPVPGVVDIVHPGFGEF